MIVTGGLGFIGSNFIHRILSSDREVEILNVDYMGMGSNETNLEDISDDKRYRFVRGDLADFTLTRKIVTGADSIVNFAAQTHVDRSIANAEPFFESNIRSVFNLVRAANETKVGRIVHISTDEVYGSNEKGSFDENSPLNPSSPYSASKAAADLIISAWNKTYDLGITVLRSTNNFGPWQHPEKLIPKAIIRGINKKGIPLYGGGNQIRDWIYVDDFCHAIELAVERGDCGGIYNISAGNEITNRQVVHQIIDQLGDPSAKIIDVEDRPGHDYRYSLNSEKARTKLGWKPAYTFDAALAKTVRWYRDHASWWTHIATEKVLSDTPWKERW